MSAPVAAPPSPLDRLHADLKTAMKSGQKETTSTLRMLLSEVMNEEMRSGAVDEGGFVKVVQRAIKQRRESADQYTKGGRPELAAKEEQEIVLLGAYLPRQVDEAVLRAAIAELVTSQSLSGPAALGAIMKAMMARFAGQADGATVSRLAREILAGR
jgi:uncharacterized protein YqeY